MISSQNVMNRAKFKEIIGWVLFHFSPYLVLNSKAMSNADLSEGYQDLTPDWSLRPGYPWFKSKVRGQGHNNSMVFELPINSNQNNCSESTLKPAVALGADWVFENPGVGYWTIIFLWKNGTESSKEWVRAPRRSHHDTSLSSSLVKFSVFYDFAWADVGVGEWLSAKTKENFILHLLVRMWVFKMVCKLIKI